MKLQQWASKVYNKFLKVHEEVTHKLAMGALMGCKSIFITNTLPMIITTSSNLQS